MSGNHLFLPPEIRYQILTKLPAKSILRFRCVCKTWQSIISGSSFISDRSIQKRVLVSRYDIGANLCKFSSHDESFVESHEHDGMPGNIVGSCDGLICLWGSKRRTGPCGSYGYHQRFLIWNPSIRKIVKLPSHVVPPPSPSGRERDCLYGFGFDSNGSDYKVLRVHPNGYNYGLDCEIFDLSKAVWRKLNPRMLPSYSSVEKSRSSVYLHGFLHWIGYDLQQNCILLSFNLSIDAFQEMGLPCAADFKRVDSHSQLYLSNVILINGLLSVAAFRRLELQGDARQGCSVWSMKEYGVTESWTKLYQIDLPPTLLCRLDFYGFSGNGELLILNCDTGKIHEQVLALYNPKSREYKALLPVKYFLDVCFYNESFVLP